MPSNSNLQIISWSLSKKCSANMRFIEMFCSVTAELSTKCHGVFVFTSLLTTVE